MGDRRYDVIGLGYCSADYLGVVPGVPAFDADTVNMAEFATDGGGPVSTALVTLARLGASVAYLGVLGDDPAGRFLQSEFQREGVATRHVLVQPGGRTPCCMVLVQAGTGRRSFMCYRGTLREVVLTDAARADLRRARLLHVDGHSLGAVEEAAAIIHEAGGQVMFDANRMRPSIERFLACTDILIAATRFPTAFTGADDLAEASRRLLATGPTTIVTTLGPDGCFCLTQDEAFHEPGFRVPVTDTTGAGDAFHGAFLYGLLKRWELRHTARFANAVAALNCRALGGRRGLPTLGEVDALLEKQQDGQDRQDVGVMQ